MSEPVAPFPGQLFPWQHSVWQQLSATQEKLDNFPHALLLNGIAGIGKKALAYYLAQGLMCHTPAADSSDGSLHPCQQCRSCQLFKAGNHPDLYLLGTAEEKKIIPVESVRELIQWTVLSSQLLHKKVVIIEPADAMNQNAANSLLKTLEEPVANTVLFLVSDSKQALLPTIRSRCQVIDMARPESSLAKQWLVGQGIEQAELMLALASGAPLKARELAREEAQNVRKTVLDKLLQIASGRLDPVAAAEQLFKLTASGKTKTARNKPAATSFDIIYWLDSVLVDIARLSQLNELSESAVLLSHLDYQQDLHQLSNRLYLKKLMQLSDSVNKAYYQIQGSVNFNLLLEKLLIDWKKCLK